MKVSHIILMLGIIAMAPIVNAAESDVNTIGCIIFNDGYFPDEPKLLVKHEVELQQDTTKLQPVYQGRNLKIDIGAASVIQPALKQSWISSFKLVVSQPKAQVITVKSYSRKDNTSDMNANLTMTDISGQGLLTIDCNTR
jgi:hypothetical protein